MSTPAQIQELIDRQHLYELVTRYCRALDRADEELLLSCYHPDATQDHGAYKGPIPGLVEQLKTRRALNPELGPVQHVVSNCRFEIKGDKARGETYVQTVMTDGEGRAELGFGRYVDRFERRDGEWRIAHRTTLLDIARPDADTSVFAPSSRNRDDPSYAGW
jgi:hypothetical protein